MNKLIAKRLKVLRVEKGLSQKAIGELVGLASNSIANYEQGKREPSLETLAKLCRFYNVSADYLIGLTDF